MFKYPTIGPFKLPTYGVMIFIGLLTCNLIMSFILKNDRDKLKKSLLIEIVGGAGAVVVAKIVGGGSYSYFGGLLGFFVAAYVLGKISGIDYAKIEEKLIFLIPLLHVFWKIGCFFGGCCFGIPYSGRFAVIFPGGINELSEAPVFPAQIAEAIAALCITIIMIWIGRTKKMLSLVGV